MILVDTSAWIEFLNATGHATDQRLRELLEVDRAVCTTPPIIMEILRGVRDDRQHASLTRFLLALPRVPVSEAAFYRAADLYRILRKRGITIRASIDCLIAAIAEGEGLSLLHNDADFEPLMRLTEVPSAPLE